MTFDELVTQIMFYEGFSATPYKCPAGVLTIGYGRTTNVKVGDKTNKEAEKTWLYSEVRKYYNTVKKECLGYGYNFNDNQYYALTCFAYNLGCGKIKTLTSNGHRTPEQIADAILLYNKATVNGKLKELAGLTKRRTWESNLFRYNITNSNIIKHSAAELQLLANKITPDLTPLTVDGIIGQKTINRLYEIVGREN